MRAVAILAAILIPAFAQVVDIAAGADGSTLLFESQFHLQSETDKSILQKIYRWQNGVWARLGVQPPNSSLIPSSISQPFVAGDGSIYGWSVLISHGLFPPVPIVARIEVHGASLPPGFPLEYVRFSGNGRFVVGGSLSPIPSLVRVPQWLDLQSGAQRALPANARSMQPASEGTVAYLLDDGGVTYAVVVAPDGSSRRFAVMGQVFGMALSDDARWVAVEQGTAGQRSVRVLRIEDASGSETIPVSVTSRKRSYWNLANGRLLWFSASDTGEIVLLNERYLESGDTRTVAESPEPFSEVAMSADGQTAWTVTETNRLWRFDLVVGRREEILPPLGHASGGSVTGVRVPGSALELRGSYTRGQQALVDGQAWPVSDVNRHGLWVQAPWEWRGAPLLTVRAENNPFEETMPLGYDGTYAPYFPRRVDLMTPDGTTVVAAHDDFHGLITAADPARPGEAVHVYMTGLGALDRDVATGERGPADLARPVRPLACSGQRIGSPERAPVFVADAVYAAGMIGIYQVEVVIPMGVPDGLWTLHCGGSPYEAAGSLFTRP